MRSSRRNYFVRPETIHYISKIGTSLKKTGDHLIIAKSDLEVTPIFDESAKDWMKKSLVSVFGILVQINYESKTEMIPVFSLYARPKSGYKEMSDVLKWIRAQTIENGSTIDRLVILGDMNAYHISWSKPNIRFSYADDNKPLFHGGRHVARNRMMKINRGKCIVRNCHKYRLKILNMVTEGPTFIRRQGTKLQESYLDVAIAGRKSAHMMSEFRLIDLGGESFHKAISISRPVHAVLSQKKYGCVLIK